MKWLLSVIKKFLTWDDPKIAPIPVRASVCLLILATSVIILFHPPLHRALAAFAMVLGCFATGIRRWAGNASDQDLQRVISGIANIGSSTKLSIRDCASVIFLAHLAFVMAFLLSAEGVQIAQQHPSQLKLPIGLALVGLWMIYFPCFPILDYLGRKMVRCLCNRWRVRLQADTSKAEFRRILDRISFAITVMVVVLALPNVLF
jgi:hypothetical protein